jgi:hypothetical protein
MLAWMAVSMPLPAAARGRRALQLKARVQQFRTFFGSQLAAFPQFDQSSRGHALHLKSQREVALPHLQNGVRRVER